MRRRCRTQIPWRIRSRSEAEQDNTDAVPADEAGSEQPEETAETVSPVQRLAQLTAELDALHNDRLQVSPHVDKKQIAAVIAEWTGVPLNRLSQNEMSVITDLPKWLGDTIKGQDLAIASLHKHLLTARADLRRPGRPLGAFLLAGPSGVGKTETVLQLAELLYGGRQYLTTINMSEFQEKHTVSRADWFASGLRWLRRRRRADRSDSPETVLGGTAR